uniref:Cupin-like domain-containing protein n=1 Tax=Glossina austeni TaxID=7395 RepID=A0A1A9UEL8_GLOAU
MFCAQQQLKNLLKKCEAKGVKVNQIKCVTEFLKEHDDYCKPKKRIYFKVILIISLLIYAVAYYYGHLRTEHCSLIMPQAMRYAFRPPENCEFCKQVKHMERVRDISVEEFTERYAYSGRPVIVEDATKNWTALEKFNYWYFRDIYNAAKNKEKVVDCQFLPYNTGFRHLYEALDMPAERVEFYKAKERGESPKPWYFGWSNCNGETAEEFREHYGRPYFLPELSESSPIDWFFMGTEGLGAQMHVDNVRLPSWQAQLAGSKRWLLAPPPECYFHCSSFEALVEKGDIIVLDTNRWYHQTFVQPGAISLTIGAEYD